MNRREFLKQTSAAVAGVGTAAAVLSSVAPCLGAGYQRVVLVSDPADSVATSTPVLWALGQLRASLARRQIEVQVASQLTDVPESSPCVFAAGKQRPVALEVLARSRLEWPSTPECLALASGRVSRRSLLLA